MLISLKTDYVFKELFAHENVRKQFLSDVLDIPLEEMKSVRIMNPFLRRRFRRQKEGILDMALEMVGGAKVNIELQVRRRTGSSGSCSTWPGCTRRICSPGRIMTGCANVSVSVYWILI
jgi:hypothetical protein